MSAAMKIGARATKAARRGFAGCCCAHIKFFISPDINRIDESILILTMVVVGGRERSGFGAGVPRC